MNDPSKDATDPAADPKLPGTYREIASKFSELTEAHAQMSRAAEHAGPLDARSQALVKIGMCVGAGLESALRSHVRRAMEQGVTREQIEHAIMLGMTTCGFPATAAAYAWANVQFHRDQPQPPAE